MGQWEMNDRKVPFHKTFWFTHLQTRSSCTSNKTECNMTKYSCHCGNHRNDLNAAWPSTVASVVIIATTWMQHVSPTFHPFQVLRVNQPQKRWLWSSKCLQKAIRTLTHLLTKCLQQLEVIRMTNKSGQDTDTDKLKLNRSGHWHR